MNTNNPITELSLAVISGLLVVAASLLLYTGKIDFAAGTVMIGSALALLGGNLALKAPSPSQQELLQQLIDALQPPTPARPITSNAYIPPDVRASLGVPARASAVDTEQKGTSS